jgi:GAF domain-containing protein
LAKIRQLTSLYEIGKALSSTLDADELIRKALQLLKDYLGHSSCGIHFLDREKNELYIKQIIGRESETVKDLRFKVSVRGVVWVAQTGEPLCSGCVARPRYIQGMSGRSGGLPTQVRDQVIGVLNVESHDIAGFDEEDLESWLFASQVSASIENARLLPN